MPARRHRARERPGLERVKGVLGQRFALGVHHDDVPMDFVMILGRFFALAGCAKDFSCLVEEQGRGHASPCLMCNSFVPFNFVRAVVARVALFTVNLGAAIIVAWTTVLMLSRNTGYASRA